MDSIDSNKTAVTVSDLSYAYPGGPEALSELSLTVPSGTRLALAGPNGSGKSTLLAHLAGLEQSEQVSIFGVTARGKANLRKIRSLSGIVFQDSDDQLFMPTVFDDVVFGPLNQDLGQNEARNRAHEALASVGMEKLADRPSHHLSGGEKRLVALASVLSMRPRLLLMDEPAANLDHTARRKLIRVLDEITRKHGITVVLATHDLEMALDLCQHAALIQSGRILAEGSLPKLFHDEPLLGKCGLEKPLSLTIQELKQKRSP